jgi:hypothetical protein
MLENKQTERRFADTAIEMALERLRLNGREPDCWEMSELTYAIGAHFRGAYRLAEVAAEKSMTPLSQRSSNFVSVPAVQFDLRQLEKAFAYVRAEPLRPCPHFGPILFKTPGRF